MVPNKSLKYTTDVLADLIHLRNSQKGSNFNFTGDVHKASENLEIQNHKLSKFYKWVESPTFSFECLNRVEKNSKNLKIKKFK